MLFSVFSFGTFQCQLCLFHNLLPIVIYFAVPIEVISTSYIYIRLHANVHIRLQKFRIVVFGSI